eukprot:3884133-Rhodomonas_salina.4
MVVVDAELMSRLSRHKLLGVAETLRVKGCVERMEDGRGGGGGGGGGRAAAGTRAAQAPPPPPPR